VHGSAGPGTTTLFSSYIFANMRHIFARIRPFVKARAFNKAAIMDNSRSITSASINDLKCERLKDTKYLHFTSLSYPIKGEESITVKENMKLKQSLQHRP